MPYRLDVASAVPDAIRTAATERLLHAADALSASADADAIHTARKDIKKTRALLRLARPALRPKQYRRVNDALRSTAQTLSGARDAHVLAETIDGLHDHAVGQLPAQSFTTLAERARRTAGEDETQADRVTQAAEALRAAAGDVATWQVDGADRTTLATGIATAYERGWEALDAAADDPGSEQLHEWRKRVKDLWYDARLLRDAAPRQLKALAADADELAALLGDEHDLAILRETLDDPDGLADGVVLDVDGMIELVDARRHALRARATVLAAHVYAERPKAFRRRLGAYLDPEPHALHLS